MKRKSFVFNFLLTSLIFCITISNVNANSYRFGVSENQELVWRCNVCNQIEMDYIFGNDWNEHGILKNLSQGRRMKWKINSVNLNESFAKLNISIWEWASKSLWGVKDNDSEIIFFSNPSDYSQELNFTNYSSLVPFVFPIPVGEYIGGLSLNEWYDVDNRVLPTLNVEIGEGGISPGVPLLGIKIIAIYNDQGILNSYKLYTAGNVVIIDISFDVLPFYVIPTLIGLICVLSLSTILYLVKKRKSVKTEKNIIAK